MNENKQQEDISPLVRRWLPDAGDEELVIATANFRRYLEVIYDIYRRVESEGRFPLQRDKTGMDARLKVSDDLPT